MSVSAGTSPHLELSLLELMRQLVGAFAEEAYPVEDVPPHQRLFTSLASRGYYETTLHY